MKYSFKIEGSSGNLYTVSFFLENDRMFSECNCIAGMKGIFCKHIYQILSGDVNSMDNDSDEVLTEFYNKLLNIKYGFEDFHNYKPSLSSKLVSNHQKDKLIHFISPEGFNIKGFGKVHLKTAIENNLIKDPIDILKLHLKKEFIIEKDIFSKVKIEKILLAIEESKKIKYINFLIALGIPYIGEEKAKIISKTTKCIDQCFNYSLDEVLDVYNFGIEASHSFIDFFASNKEYINNLLKEGVEISYDINKYHNETLKLKKVAFTGKLSQLERREVKSLVEKLGGESVDVINSDLDILVIGQKVGSKLEKAKKIPTILILTEAEFLERYCFEIFS